MLTWRIGAPRVAGARISGRSTAPACGALWARLLLAIEGGEQVKADLAASLSLLT